MTYDDIRDVNNFFSSILKEYEVRILETIHNSSRTITVYDLKDQEYIRQEITYMECLDLDSKDLIKLVYQLLNKLPRSKKEQIKKNTKLGKVLYV